MENIRFLEKLNFIQECRRSGLSLWQCPSFLFLIMGILIIISSLSAYILGTRFIDNPAIVALIVLILTAILLVIAFIITKSFEKLAETNRLKSEFIKIMSHQLRSPITNLNWTTDILISKINDEKNSGYLKILKENINRMSELVKDLLIVSRIEEGSLKSNKEDVSLDSIVKKLILRFQPFFAAYNIKLNTEIEEKLPAVFADLHQIEIVIENLLDNAVRYTKEKGEITIKIQKKNKDIYFEIKDTGIGIPKKDQKFIFQKFFRAENARKKQTQGSGLGLFITKSIIEKSNGKIGFSSQEGMGSTFWFTLPIKKD